MVDPIVRRTLTEIEIYNRAGNRWRRVNDGGWVIHPGGPTEPGPLSPGDPEPGPGGVIPPPTGSRANLTTGNYKPDATTTGNLPNITRTVYSGGTVLNQADTWYTNMEFYSRISIQAPGLKFFNCSFYGGTDWPGSQTGTVDCRSSAVLARVSPTDPWNGVPYFEDCFFKPQRPSYYLDNIMGSFYVKRCHITWGNDGCGIYNTSGVQGAHAKVEASYIHDLTYWYPEPAHADGTHNDLIQIQSGGYIHVIGNNLVGTAHRGDDRAFSDPDGAFAGGTLSGTNPDKPTQLTQSNGPHINGGGMIIQRNTGIPLDNNVIAEKNWFNKGGTALNLKDGVYTVRNNIITRLGFYYYSNNINNQYPIRPTSAATGAKITGLYNSNRYEDNNELLTEANGGIRY